jgi:predicted Holliday junction resolvase-like endonuclease
MNWDDGDMLKLFVAALILYLIHLFCEKFAALKAKAEEAEAEAKATAIAKAQLEAKQQQAAEIQREYMYIDEETRHRLRALAEERIQRQHIVLRPGDIEAAVVTMYRRSQSRL